MERSSRTVQNFDDLATTALRKDALEILEAGYAAIHTETVINSHIKREGDVLTVKDKAVDLSAYERVFFVGIGKCAADAAEVFDKLIGDKITDGIVVDVRGVTLKKIRSRIGTHPLPTEENREAAMEIKKMLTGLTERDLVFTVISGGGSALLCLPHDLSCKILAEMTEKLMKAGATIDELNVVRKHTSDIQGGQLAKMIYPAKMVATIFSDVPGNDLGTIASGPTVKDESTQEDAERILVKYQVRAICVMPHCDVIETPKEDKYFENVDNILLLTNEEALRAMEQRAEDLGYDAQVIDTHLVGEARDVGARLAREAGDTRTCLIYGGETTVTVTGKGKGGRNQELVLGALPYVDIHTLVVAAASDGWDNSDVAGAIGDVPLREKAEKLLLDGARFLHNNDSYTFFETAGAHIVTGRTGTNVSDLYFTLRD